MNSGPPPVAVNDPDGRRRRMSIRFWQLQILLATILTTIWFCSLGGWGVAISLFAAKHILVATFAAGLHLPRED